jgi:hypothetical protein
MAYSSAFVRMAHCGRTQIRDSRSEKLAEFADVCRLFGLRFFLRFVIVTAVLTAEIFSILGNAILAFLLAAVVAVHFLFCVFHAIFLH